jgi:hypothetical protein
MALWKARIWDALELACVGDETTAWNSTPILNAPKLCFEDTYDFNARVSQADLQAWQSQKHYDFLRSALRSALRDRCKLAIHEELAQGGELGTGSREAWAKTKVGGSALRPS